MNAPQSFGEWLRHRRRELDLTQDALARQVGCARVTIRKLEADEMRPSKQLAELLAEQLGIPPDERATFVRLGRGGLPVDLVTATMPRHNLPIQLSSFIGREREIAQIKALLSKNRLVTLTGAGGSGKTRLAIQAATDLTGFQNLSGLGFDDGVWWIELASLMDASLVAEAVAKTLGVREASNQPLQETLAHALRSKPLLLVLDNCEHLIMACAQLAEYLLSRCVQLKILATSREPLAITGESVFPVPTLSLPELQTTASPETLMKFEAIQLFVDRALSVKPDFALSAERAPFVVQICHRLDGIPLAIELATARLKMLSVEQIALRLSDQFDLLITGSRTALPRQQTLRATIDWSYALLNEPERVLFRRLSVFAGGFDLEAAEAVCSDESLDRSDVLNLLGQLVDKSLVNIEAQTATQHQQTRYHLLETIRQYALEKLVASSEATTIRNRHLSFYLDLAEKAEPHTYDRESTLWHDRVALDFDNILAALDWAASSGQAIAVLHITGSLVQYWFTHGRSFSEWYRRVEAALASPEGMARTNARAKVLSGMGLTYWGDMTPIVDRRHRVEEALAIGQELGDKWIVATALRNLGFVAGEQGDYEEARACLEQSLEMWQEMGNEFEIGQTLTFLGQAVMDQGDDERALSFFEQSMVILKELGNSNVLALALRRLGQLAWRAGEYDKAASLCKESLLLNRETYDPRGVLACIAGFADMAVLQGKFERAARLMAAVETLLASLGLRLILQDRLEYERHLSVLRSQMEEASFTAEWSKGCMMTFEQAVDFALQL